MGRPDTEAAVRALVNDAAFKRGKELVSSKKLQDVAFEGDGLEKASAVCEGSNPGDCYDVSINVDPEVTCSCSCPAKRGGLCKHAIGLLLHRVNQLQGKGGASTSAEVKNEEEEEEEQAESSKAVVEWVRNPVKIIPDPQARRVLPGWMNASVSEKPKKPRASKKQKVDEGDGSDEPQTSGRKAAAGKKGGGSRASSKADDDAQEAVAARGKGKAKQDADDFLDDDEPVRPARKPSSRQKKASEDEEQAERRGGSRGRSKKPHPAEEELSKADEDGTSSGDTEEVVRPKGRGRKVDKEQDSRKAPQNKRRLEKVVEDEEEEETGDGADQTMDELLSIAQKNLENRESPNSMTETDPTINLTAATIPSSVSVRNSEKADVQPAKKKTRLDNTMFFAGKWSGNLSDDRPNKEGDSDGPRLSKCTEAGVLGRGGEAEIDHPKAASNAAKAISDDPLADFIGLMCPVYGEPVREASPVREIEISRTLPVPTVVLETPTQVPAAPPVPVIQGQPKKKSSLKDKMKLLGL